MYLGQDITMLISYLAEREDGTSEPVDFYSVRELIDIRNKERDLDHKLSSPRLESHFQQNYRILKPQRIKQLSPMRRVKGGSANYDGDMGVYIPDYRPGSNGMLSSNPIKFKPGQLENDPSLYDYQGDGTNSSYFIKTLSDKYKQSGKTEPYLYHVTVGGIPTRLGRLSQVNDTLLIRFYYGIPLDVITRSINWLSSHQLENIGTLYPVMDNNGFNYRSSVDCLESVLISGLGIDRRLVYAITDINLTETEPSPVRLLDSLGKESRYGNKANATRYGNIYLMQNEDRNITVSRLQFRPRKFVDRWLDTHPLSDNMSFLLKDDDPISGKAAVRKYRIKERNKKYKKGRN
jgi:hypothetical protein